MSRGRDMAVTDTFTLEEPMVLACVAETAKMMRTAALARACRVARRAQPLAATGSLAQYREYERALERVLDAAEVLVGVGTTEDDAS